MIAATGVDPIGSSMGGCSWQGCAPIQRRLATEESVEIETGSQPGLEHVGAGLGISINACPSLLTARPIVGCETRASK
jgi:hypothetical protein